MQPHGMRNAEATSWLTNKDVVGTVLGALSRARHVAFMQVLMETQTSNFHGSLGAHLKLKNRIALVTGAARGIGLAIAERFVAEGAKVTIADVLDAEGKAAAKRIGADYVHCDVSDAADIAKRRCISCESTWCNRHSRQQRRDFHRQALHGDHRR